MLAENIDRWNRELWEKGVQEGEARVLLRQLRVKFGAIDLKLREPPAPPVLPPPPPVPPQKAA